MEALNIAFDIIIVGALALPWVILVIHLFFSDDEHSLKKLLEWVQAQKQPALAGVLLFAMTYALGSAVCRIAQDFYDDDDLHVHIFHRLFRIGATESSIRIRVFCKLRDAFATNLDDPRAEKPEPSQAAGAKRGDITSTRNPSIENAVCGYVERWVIQTYDRHAHQRITADSEGTQPITANWINDQQDRAGDIFRLHEAAVLLKGTDPTERIRQFQHQIMVLRGAAFNGLVFFSFYLFCWSAKFHPGLGWTESLIYALLGLIALGNHLAETPISSPPYMEFTLLVLAAAGWCVPYSPKGKRGQGALPRLRYLALAAFLTFAASLGWWATQVLYDEQIIFSYAAMNQSSTQPPTPSQK
jgi:hypothetical protein